MAFANAYTTDIGGGDLVLKFTWEELRDHCDKKIKEEQEHLDRFGSLATDDALKKHRYEIAKFTVIRDHLPESDQMLDLSSLRQLGIIEY